MWPRVQQKPQPTHLIAFQPGTGILVVSDAQETSLVNPNVNTEGMDLRVSAWVAESVTIQM